MDVLDSAIRQQQTIGMFEMCRSARGTIDDVMEVDPVLGMDALHHQVYCWLNRAVVLEDAIGFV